MRRGRALAERSGASLPGRRGLAPHRPCGSSRAKERAGKEGGRFLMRGRPRSDGLSDRLHGARNLTFKNPLSTAPPLQRSLAMNLNFWKNQNSSGLQSLGKRSASRHSNTLAIFSNSKSPTQRICPSIFATVLRSMSQPTRWQAAARAA